jgi:trimeric autotransporter adhesin
VNLSVSGCGTLSGAYWVDTVTNDPLGPSSLAAWNCGGTCNTTVPTLGNGTYQGFYAGQTYGSYSTITTSLNTGAGQPEASIYFVLTPGVTSGRVGNTGSVNTLQVGASAIQFTAYATYADGSTATLPDGLGNTAAWSSSNPSILNVSSTGSVSCQAAGSANVQVIAQPSDVAFSPWAMTCTVPPTLTSLSLAATGGVSSIAYGSTNQILATCHYSDGSTTSCNSADSRGNVASAWSSSASQYVSISGSGLATGVAIGSGNLTAVAGGLTSAALTLQTVSQKTLSGVTLGNTGSVHSIPIGGTIQFHAYCAYSNASTQDCSVTDIYGDVVTAWGSSNTAVMSMQNVGGASPGLATGLTAGSANATAVVNGVTNATPYAVTVTPPAVTLTGISIAPTGGVTGLFIPTTNQLIATCKYSDGSTTNCTTADSHGNTATNWVSSNTAAATVSSSGLAAAVSPGTTTFTAHAGTFTSSGLPLTILAVPTGVYQITITGPVSFSGFVRF